MKFLRDIVGRVINMDSIIYIGEVDDDCSTSEFKERYRGKTPKKGYHIRIKDLVEEEDTSYLFQVKTKLPRFEPSDIDIDNINIAYYGMQFIHSKKYDKTYYLFILKDGSLNMFSYIKKGRVSYSVVDELLSLNGYFKVLEDSFPIDITKSVVVYINIYHNTLVSVLTDERLYNVINVIHPIKKEDSDYECRMISTTRTSAIMRSEPIISREECKIEDIINNIEIDSPILKDIFHLPDDMHCFLDDKKYLSRYVFDLKIYMAHIIEIYY